MPIGEVRLQPGQNVELTPTYNSAGIVDTQYGRFRAGVFEKLGGWQKFYPFGVNGDGKCLHAWLDLNFTKHLAIATTTEIDVITTGFLSNITPQAFLSDTAENFSTTNGDATVTIVDTNINNVTPEDSVEFLTPISVGGLILSGIYRITERVSSTSYRIEARANATANVANGGAVPVFDTTADSTVVSVTLANHAQVVGNDVVFPLPTVVGGITIQGKYNVTSVTTSSVFTINSAIPADTLDTQAMNGGDAGFRYYIALGATGAGLGYGLGGYGLGGYGLGGGGGTDQTGDPIQPDDWCLDNWGELLMASPENEAIYFWGPNSGFTNMSVIVEAPLYNTGMFVSSALQQIIAYGSSINAWDLSTQLSGIPGIGVYQDPLLVQWCDLSNFFEWGARADTQAGNFRIPVGSRCVGGAATKNRNLLWTDLELWAFTYIGQPQIYSENNVGSKCGLIGKHAHTQYADATYWMSDNNFYVYSGSGVLPIPCDVWDAVFQDLDKDNGHKCMAGSNSDFSEVWFSFPTLSGNTGDNDRTAVYNVIQGIWVILPFGRSAWTDRSILGNPIGLSTDGLIYSHEVGRNADDQPLTPSMTSGYFMLESGGEIVDVDELWPDFKWGEFGGTENAQISLELLVVNWPGEDPAVNGPYIVTKSTPFVAMDPPIRGRQAAVRISSSDIDSFWRMGLLRFKYRPAGRQP